MKNLENLLEMMETKNELDMLIEDTLDSMSTQELEMLTEQGIVGRTVLGAKNMIAKSRLGQRYGMSNNASDVRLIPGTLDVDELKTMGAQFTRGEANRVKDIARLKSAAKKTGKVAGAAAVVGGAGAIGYGSGKKKGQKQGVKAGIVVGAKLAKQEMLRQIAAEKDAKRRASLIYKAKKLFGMED